MNKVTHLGELEQTVLVALERLGRPSTGRDVYREIIEVTGRDTSVAGIHVTLGRLRKKGLLDLTMAAGPEGVGRDVRHFDLSAKGHEAIHRARDYWVKLWTETAVRSAGGNDP